MLKHRIYKHSINNEQVRVDEKVADLKICLTAVVYVETVICGVCLKHSNHDFPPFFQLHMGSC